LLTTDADTVAPPGWVAANLAALRGVDAVAGRAVIDPREAALIPRHLHELDAQECRYAALLDEIAALLAPEPHDPWPRHDEHSGASIALRASGARIRHAPEVWVTVSGRLDGRAQGGMADTIRARIANPPIWLDDRLTPVSDWVRRLEGAGPSLTPRRVAFAALDSEMRQAVAVRDALRRAANGGLRRFQQAAE
jgi:hypothetical protein